VGKTPPDQNEAQTQSPTGSGHPDGRLKWKARPAQLLFLVAGTVALGVGMVGVFLPGLPTTPFLLMAAACYARSSARLYRWLLGHPRLGPPIRQFLAGKGLPIRVKAWSLGLAYLLLGLTALIFVSGLWARLLLLGVALAKTYYFLCKLPTAEE